MMKNKYLLSIAISSCLFANTQGVWAADEPPKNTLPMSHIIQELKSSGVHVIKEIKFENGNYVAETVNPQGTEVKTEINPTTGKVNKTDNKSENIKLSILEAAKRVEGSGYKNIYKIDTSGTKYEVKAYDQQGKKVSLDVDGNTGEISKNLF